MKMPLCLKNKLFNEEGNIYMDQQFNDVTTFGDSWKTVIPGMISYQLKLDLRYDRESLEACVTWLYSHEMITIGPYRNILPTEIEDSMVTFVVGNYDTKYRNWKDWFVQEDTIYREET